MSQPVTDKSLRDVQDAADAFWKPVGAENADAANLKFGQPAAEVGDSGLHIRQPRRSNRTWRKGIWDGDTGVGDGKAETAE
jgi:hypothetical protein